MELQLPPKHGFIQKHTEPEMRTTAQDQEKNDYLTEEPEQGGPPPTILQPIREQQISSRCGTHLKLSACPPQPTTSILFPFLQHALLCLLEAYSPSMHLLSISFLQHFLCMHVFSLIYIVPFTSPAPQGRWAARSPALLHLDPHRLEPAVLPCTQGVIRAVHLRGEGGLPW